MATELFANQPLTTVTSGGTTAPSSGTTETWTVASSSSFPAAATGTSQFHVCDTAAGSVSEIIAVTNVSGATWSVTRGAESTTPVAHTSGFTVQQVVTAGWLGSVAPLLTPTAVKAGAYTAAAGDYVPCDTTSGGFTVTLPSAPADMTVAGVKHVTQGSTGGVPNTVTIACGGSDVLNKAGGSTSVTLALLAQGILLQYKASLGVWYVTSDDLPLPQLDLRYQGSYTYAVTQGNAVQLTGCTLTNGQASATFAGASLTAGDAGKAVAAVHGSDYLVTAIASVTDATHAVLAASWAGATTTGAQVTYGTDLASAINTEAAALHGLGGGRILIASPVLCTAALSIPDQVVICGLGFTFGSVIYAGHYGNIIQSSLWGQAGTAQNQYVDAYDLELVGLLPVTQPALGAADSAGTGSYLFTTVQLTPGTLSQTFTSGAFPVSSTLDSRWPAGSAGSPVYFWHNNVAFKYTSTTPFATASIADPSVSSVTILTHGFVYPLNSQGHGVALQSFRGKISHVRTSNTLGSGVRVQGSGTADPTAYGHRIEWVRSESPGWACLELGEATTDDFVTIVSGTSPGIAGVVVMGGDPTVQTVHIVGQATRPWVPHVVACPTNGSYRDVILDTCYGAGFVFDGGLQFRGVGPSQSRLDGLRYLGSPGKPGHGIPILAKTRASTVLIGQVGISGVTFVQDCAFLFAHGPQTQMGNGASVSLSTTAATLPVLDVTAFDAQGGKANTTHAGSTRTATYAGVSVNTTLTGGAQQTVTIGSGGTLALAQALPALPSTGDWYIVGGVLAVQVSSSNAGGTSLVYGSSVSLYGASGGVNIAGGSFVSRQALTGVTITSGTQTMAAGDTVVQATLQAGQVQGSISVPGATGPALPVPQPAIAVKSTDALLVTQNSQVGTGTGGPVVTVTASYGIGASDQVILLNGATLTATLPTAVAVAGKTYTVKLIASATTATIATTSSQTVDGAATYSLSAQNKYVTVVSDGAGWQVVASN
jgi:hypothetical protein